MGFREFRPCQIDGGCPSREGEFREFAGNLSTQYAFVAFAGRECQIEGDCQTANEALNDRDPAAKYIDEKPVSTCPRIAEIQFRVLDSFQIDE